MKKIFAAFALAASLGLGLTAGANAQTVTSNPPGTYTVNITETTTSVVGGFQYSYLATLDTANSASNAVVNGFQFNFNDANAGTYDPLSVTATGAGFVVSQEQADLIQFASTTGLSSATPTATFSYVDPLPPTGQIGITPGGKAGTTAVPGIGNNFIGPGAVPEPGSFALLGLGLLPLALVARRRMSSRA